MTRIARMSAIAALLCVALPSQATIISYQTTLGPEAAGATGTGFVTVDYDTLAHTLNISSNWSGLSGTTTVAHIHCCVSVPATGTVGVAVTPSTLPGFPVGVSAGSYSTLIDLTLASNFTANFISNFAGGIADNAEEALITGLNNGSAYFNIHTTLFSGGEIRGFPAAVPEASTYAMMLAGLGLVGAMTRRRKQAEV